MNPRQRRGVLLMIVAVIGAVAVFFTVVSYVNTLRAEIGEYKTVLTLKQDVPAYSAVTPEMVEETQVPKKFFKKTFVTDIYDEIPPGSVGVSSTKLPKGAMIQKGMIIPSPELASGEREIAIMVDAETGVAGKVRSGSKVDIYATFDDQQGSPVGKEGSCAMRVLTDVRVLDVGVVRSETDPKNGATGGSVPVTFQLDSDQTLLLTYAESFSASLRLALISPEGSGSPGGVRFCSGDFGKLAEELQKESQQNSQNTPDAGGR